MTLLVQLNAVLPATGLHAQDIAIVAGDGTDSRLLLRQPPAGQAEPMVDVEELLEFLACETGRSRAELADVAYPVLQTLEVERRPVLLDDLNDTHRCVPVGALVPALASLAGPVADAALFLARCAEVVTDFPMFVYGEFGMEPHTLRQLPQEPLPSALIEPLFGLPTDYGESELPDGNVPLGPKTLAWRDGMRSRIEALSAAVGGELFHYADLEDRLDDDLAHRLLALDFISHMQPQSPFVTFLMRAVGAPSIEAFRALLVSPGSYPPGSGVSYDMQVEAAGLPTFDIGRARKRRIGIVCADALACPRAEAEARTRIGGNVVAIVDDPELQRRLRTAASRVGAACRACSLPRNAETRAALLSDLKELRIVASDFQRLRNATDPADPAVALLTQARSIGLRAELRTAQGCLMHMS